MPRTTYGDGTSVEPGDELPQTYLAYWRSQCPDTGPIDAAFAWTHACREDFPAADVPLGARIIGGLYDALTGRNDDDSDGDGGDPALPPTWIVR